MQLFQKYLEERNAFELFTRINRIRLGAITGYVEIVKMMENEELFPLSREDVDNIYYAMNKITEFRENENRISDEEANRAEGYQEYLNTQNHGS